MGVVPAAGGPVVWMKAPGDPHDIYIPLIDWAGNAKEVVFQQLNRLQNTNQVQLGDAATGEVRTMFVDKDEAWLDDMTRYVWLAGGKGLFWLSERDGWRHAYYVSRDGKEVRLMTPGDYDVMSVDAIDEKAGLLYVTASPDNATTRFQYRVRMDGTGKPERVGPAGQTGVHRYDVSPTARWAFHTFSTLDTPPQTELVRLPGGETVRPLAANAALRAKVEALNRKRVEYTKLDIGGGIQVDSWRILPPNFDPAKKYPLFVYVYGEPAGQTVQDSWGGNNYLWHLMLAQQGYIVASFDNRGTPAPRGRAWRKSVYRQIGILASADQAAAVRAAIAAWPFVDADRVGSWGWSGGGQMTLNAIFRYPDLYKTGMAVAFVSDQRLYDTIYQERFMGLPQDNAGGYKNGSPITFAKNLKGNLLIVHGTGDDNVHYQSFEMLVNELIANGKAFTMMLFLEFYAYWKLGPSAGGADGAPMTGWLQFLIVYVLVPLVPGLAVGYLTLTPATRLSHAIDWIRQPSAVQVERQMGQAMRDAAASERRVAGLRALAQFGSPDALDELARLATGSPQLLNELVVRRAGGCLRRLGGRPSRCCKTSGRRRATRARKVRHRRERRRGSGLARTYPNRSHGISEGTGTTMHLYTLLTTYLNTHMPPGARSEAISSAPARPPRR